MQLRSSPVAEVLRGRGRQHGAAAELRAARAARLVVRLAEAADPWGGSLGAMLGPWSTMGGGRFVAHVAAHVGYDLLDRWRQMVT